MAAPEKVAGQQRLALEEQVERSLPPNYASYEWTGEGLSERSGSDLVAYCYWDQPFACTIRRQHRDAEDFLPTWPVFDAPDYGRATGDKSVLAHHPRTLGTGIAAGPGADKALDEYLATLPRLLTRLAAPFGAQQWLVLDLFRRSEGLWKLFHRQAALGRLGALSLALELFSAAGRTAPRQRDSFADYLSRETRETVLFRFLKKNPSPSLLALLEQLPPGAGLLEERDFKAALAKNDDTAARACLERLREKQISNVLSNTDWGEKTDARRLVDSGMPLPRLIATINGGLRNLTASERPAALSALKKVRAPQALQWWLTHWTMLAGRSRNVPEPPIPCAPLLTPLGTAGALHQEAQRMRNGVDRFLPEVLAGDLFFYHFDGIPAATICLAATENGDWVFLEAVGEDGAKLQEGVYADIVPALLPRQT
eukprot:g1912.t1